jgi:hypothetical protein
MEKKNWFPRDDTPEHAVYGLRPNLPGMEWLPCVARPTTVSGRKTKFSCKGINKTTNQITKDKYMDVLLSKKSGSGIKSTRIYRKELGFHIFTPNEKCWQMECLQ